MGIAIGATIFAASAYENNQASNHAADAAQGAADAQAQAAAQTRAQVLAQGQTNQTQAMNLAAATPQELAMLGQSYAAAQSNLAQQQKMINAVDPSLMEASKQALAILQGGNAGLTSASNAQRAQQRQTLVNQLRSQYGPGAETSSIGSRALSNFDMQSDLLSQQTNQTALSQLWGMANTDVTAPARAGVSQMQQVQQGYSALQDRSLNAQLNTGNAMLGALSGTSQQMIQAAGAPYVGASVQAQGQAAQAQGLAGLGGTVMGYGMMRTPTTAPTATTYGTGNSGPSTGYFGNNLNFGYGS